jgi:predicted AAA+ superfamily ATPase
VPDGSFAVPAGNDAALSPSAAYPEADSARIMITAENNFRTMLVPPFTQEIEYRQFPSGYNVSQQTGQILSYQKMLGQLQDAGNTTTLAHYLELLAGAGMLKGISKFSGKKVMQRGSSPKLQVLNTALMTSQSWFRYASARKDRDYWGRLVESAVGAHLLNGAEGTRVEIYYWRDRGHEVDFVLQSGERAVSLEVKSGRARSDYSGMDAFGKNFQPFRKLLVGGQGIPLEEFLATPISNWVE